MKPVKTLQLFVPFSFLEFFWGTFGLGMNISAPARTSNTFALLPPPPPPNPPATSQVGLDLVLRSALPFFWLKEKMTKNNRTLETCWRSVWGERLHSK